ncbi:MAG: hypothetical protein R6V12_03050 [Candidatus Hydrogenedentota bacterium]
MKRRKKTKFVHEGGYVAEIEVELMEDETGWSPYISVEDARRLDGVRKALHCGNLKSAQEYGPIYELRPISQH